MDAIDILGSALANSYILGTDVLIGVAPIPGMPPQVVLPSVNEYRLASPEDFEEEPFDIDQIVGDAQTTVVGMHRGPFLWPRGNYVWPGVDVEDAIARLSSGRPREDVEIVGAVEAAIDVLGAQPQVPTLWEGTEEELLSRLDLERRFDEKFDDAMIRRTGKMRG